MLRQVLFVAVGSAIGGVARFLIGKGLYGLYPQPFPLPTLAINIAGSLLIGLLFGFASKSSSIPPDIMLMLTVGLCGGFTTFSAFSYENIVLMRSGAYTMVLVYITASVSMGILATWLGIELTR